MGKGIRIGEIGKALLVSVVVTLLFLAGVALLMLQIGLDEAIVSKLMLAGYVLAPAAGGFLLGKKKKEKRYLWGILIGVLYFAVFLLVSILVQNGSVRDVIWTILPMGLGGMAGGMLS